MAKKVLTPEQAEIKALKKQKASKTFSGFVAFLLATVLTVGVLATGKSNAKKAVDNVSLPAQSTQTDKENSNDNPSNEVVIDDDGKITIIETQQNKGEGSEENSTNTIKTELSSNPEEWTTEQIVAFYKTAAQKSSKVVSSQVYLMPKLVVNDGDGVLGWFLDTIKPVIDDVLVKNTTSYEGITGGFYDLSASDLESAKAYKSGEHIVIEMYPKEQTDGIYGDMHAGSVGHAINVLGNVATAVEQFPAFDIKFEEADIKIHYAEPTVKVRIDKNGVIEKGVWSYLAQIYIRNLKINFITIDKADAEIKYEITAGGGF